MGFLDVGPLELLVIIAVALIVFGPERLPEVIGKVGRFVGQFRRMADEVTREFTRELNIEDASRTTPSYTPPPPPPVYSQPPSYAGLTSPPTYEPVSYNPDTPAETSENRILETSENTPAVGFAEAPYVNGSLSLEKTASETIASETDDDWYAEQDGPVPYQPVASAANGYGTDDSYQIVGEPGAGQPDSDETAEPVTDEQPATPIVTAADGVRH